VINECKVVDNRVFLLGLDKLYRDVMRQHEHGELLTCARRVAKVLRVSPAIAPVEGYYAEEEALTEYFLLMRALQSVRKEARSSVESTPEFRRLVAVASSPIFGVPEQDGLLPIGRDPLSRALGESRPWTLGGLTAAARDIARATDDISLVGLAALAGDSVMLAATRESVVLYAVKTMSLAPRMPTYVWKVDDELAHRARRFVDTFNRLFGEELPPPEPAQAERYWHAHKSNNVVGRCVQLGYDDTRFPNPYYHWAIHRGPDGELVVDEFWKDEIWTTTRYDRAAHPRVIGHRG
jgi:hypothetical protein